MSRILITGGAGFIGSHLCERFLSDRHTVLCLDNFITGRKENIRQFEREGRFDLITHNIAKQVEIKGKIDFVLHFASCASPVDYLKHPIPTLKSGSLGTHNALGLALAKKAKFLLASTSEVYGDPLEHPQKENYWGNVNPVGVRGCYDESKRFAEAITMAYMRTHKVDTRIVRIFNTYGPRMRLDDGRVVPNFVSQAFRGKPLTVYGSGEQTRSFCYIDDLVEGICRLMAVRFHEPVNLGNPNEFTVMQLVRLILKISGSRSRIIFKPLPQDDPKVRRPSIARAKSLLGWSPKVRLEQGLNLTIASLSKGLS
jgi:dTDP-glucose 4,6-dehydratase